MKKMNGGGRGQGGRGGKTVVEIALVRSFTKGSQRNCIVKAQEDRRILSHILKHGPSSRELVNSGYIPLVCNA